MAGKQIFLVGHHATAAEMSFSGVFTRGCLHLNKIPNFIDMALLRWSQSNVIKLRRRGRIPCSKNRK